MSNGKNINYKEYKNFSTDERNLYQFGAFQKIHDLDKKYAKKWVEKVLIYGGSIAGTILLGAMIRNVVMAG